MKRIFASILTLLAVYTNAQVPTEDAAFLETFIRQVKTDGCIVYTDKINNTDLLSVLMTIKEGTLKGNTPETVVNSINISKQERKEIEKQIRQLAKPYWSQKLFLDSKMITEENVVPYIKTVYQQYSETYADPRNTPLDKANLLKNTPQPYVFEFTPPLFMRNNTYCFVYMKTECGSGCSTSEISFFKKDNEKWECFIVVSLEQSTALK